MYITIKGFIFVVLLMKNSKTMKTLTKILIWTIGMSVPVGLSLMVVDYILHSDTVGLLTMIGMGFIMLALTLGVIAIVSDIVKNAKF